MARHPAVARSAGADALAALYEDCADIVHRAVVRAAVDPAEVDDVVHDVFLSLQRKAGTRPQHVTVQQWAFAEARRVAFSHRRAKARRCLRRMHLAHAPYSMVGDRPADPEELLDARRTQRRVRAFVASLPDAQREVFVALQLQRRSAAELAAELGVPVDTVYSRLRLARKKFRREMTPRPARASHALAVGILLRRGAAIFRPWLLVTMLGGGAAWVLLAPDAPVPWSPSTEADATRRPAPPRDAPRPPQRAVPPAATASQNEDDRSTARPASLPARTPAMAPAGSGVPASPRRRRAPPQEAQRPARREDPPLAPVDALEAEVVALERGRAQLRAHDFVAASETMRAYAKRHPNGVLAAEALALALEAACGANQGRDIARIRSQLRSRYGARAKSLIATIDCDDSAPPRRNTP